MMRLFGVSIFVPIIVISYNHWQASKLLSWLLLKSSFVCVSDSRDVSCWGCNANSTLVRSINANNYSKSLLQSVVSVVKFIAERGLTFRHDENVGSPRKFFQTKFQKKKIRCLWWSDLQQFHKSLIIANYHVAS